MIKPIEWKQGEIEIIDQTLLPGEFKKIILETPEQLWEAIKKLRVRGAPAIGIAAAYGIAMEAFRYQGDNVQECIQKIFKVSDYLATSRPTAVNLFWALERMKKVLECSPNSIEQVRANLLNEAHAILDEDIEMGKSIGNFGADILRDGDVVLTHCNAGGLATGGYGTALGVIYAAQEQGKNIKVFADETRPLLQGSRLTAWELMQNNVDVTLICDNMAASVMRDQGVGVVIVGADRIAANGDFANKIGTYGLAVLAHAHNIPFYSAAPFSTIDLSLKSGAEIPIEMREANELRHGNSGDLIAPADVSVHNPAFDITPAHLLTGIITEKGIATAPFEESLTHLNNQQSNINRGK